MTCLQLFQSHVQLQLLRPQCLDWQARSKVRSFVWESQQQTTRRRICPEITRYSITRKIRIICQQRKSNSAECAKSRVKRQAGKNPADPHGLQAVKAEFGGDEKALINGLPEDLETLIGWEVVSVLEDRRAGSVIEVLGGCVVESTQQVLLRLQLESDLGGGEALIPAVPEILPYYLPDVQRLYINPPAGLLELARHGEAIEEIRQEVRAFHAESTFATLAARTHPVDIQGGVKAWEALLGSDGKDLEQEGVLTMPTRKELEKAGRSELVAAITACGGFLSVAHELGLRTRRRPTGYWEDLNNLSTELDWFIAASWTIHVEPDAQDEYFYNIVTEEISWEKPDPLSDLPSEDEQRWMPTRSKLFEAGRYDLHHAIVQRGGYREVKKMLNRKTPIRNCYSHLMEIEALIEELDSFMYEEMLKLQELGTVGKNLGDTRLPTAQQLLDAGRPDLLHAILHHGGAHKVAKLLGTQTVRRRKGHWHKIDVVCAELDKFVDAHQGLWGKRRMPTHQELRDAKRHDLRYGVQLYGSRNLARRLGLGLDRRGGNRPRRKMSAEQGAVATDNNNKSE
ncbi:hypothetical protein CYMTET_13263 [Cymbomonas tetramitiformis]|uniref:WW domain-containing protein n=1 Tax=Cymbomonas tetramitiformis TaxID=36881 RepID=A0AAE0LB88_9CHLO|nr:hypothetical protein CYMTET_13263 [Cymbomonas tetramitiformis]